MSAKGAFMVAAAALLVLAGCGNKEPTLMNIRSSTNGPDEFAILPPKALEMPEDLAALPDPTPGGENRTDPRPKDDAVIALGGKPRTASEGVPAGDGALYSHAARNGVQGGIRETLASEDLDWRRKNNGRILERLFGVNVYFKSYRKQRLDQQAELERWRKAGARAPAAPPRQPDED